MMKKSIYLAVPAVLALTACVSPPHTQQNPQITQQNLQLLNEFSEFKKELRTLRSSVEEMQFETDNMQRRQNDLFEDVDRRLLNLEARAGISGGMSSGVSSGLNSGASIGVPQPDATISADGNIAYNSQQQTDDTQRTPEDMMQPPQNDILTTDAQNPATTATVGQDSTRDSLTVLEEKVYDDAVRKLQQSRYAEAIEGFSRLVEDWPQSELADDSYFYMGEAQYVNRQYEQALNSFRQVVRNYPQSTRLPDSLLKVGMIQYDVGAYSDAKETFRTLLDRFPEHSTAELARTRLLRIEQIIQ